MAEQLTNSDVPTQVPYSVKPVESERCSKKSLARIFDDIRQTSNELDNMGAVESAWCNEVCQRESIQHCQNRIARASFFRR
jgi:hypothetical protein